jgi:hypothetical protein
MRRMEILSAFTLVLLYTLVGLFIGATLFSAGGEPVNDQAWMISFCLAIVVIIGGTLAVMLWEWLWAL